MWIEIRYTAHVQAGPEYAVGMNEYRRNEQGVQVRDAAREHAIEKARAAFAERGLDVEGFRIEADPSDGPWITAWTVQAIKDVGFGE